MEQPDTTTLGEKASAALPAQDERPTRSSTAPLAHSVWVRRLIIALTMLAWLVIGAVVLAVLGHYSLFARAAPPALHAARAGH